MTCLVPDCGVVTAAVELGLGPEAIATEPLVASLCLVHARKIFTERKRVLRENASILCYGDAGRCRTRGALYPSGLWCPEHTPGYSSPVEFRPTWATTISPVISAATISPVISEEPVLHAVYCPEDKMPTGVRSAIKQASINGWQYTTTMAIGPEPDPVVSVVAMFYKGSMRLGTRHEQKPGKPMSFAAGWLVVNNKWPVRLGWRQVMDALKGVDVLDDRPQLVAAMSTCMDMGFEVVRVVES